MDLFYNLYIFVALISYGSRCTCACPGRAQKVFCFSTCFSWCHRWHWLQFFRRDESGPHSKLKIPIFLVDKYYLFHSGFKTTIVCRSGNLETDSKVGLKSWFRISGLVTFNILQTNVQSVRNQLLELEHVCAAKLIDVICISEHWIKDNDSNLFCTSGLCNWRFVL